MKSTVSACAKHKGNSSPAAVRRCQPGDILEFREDEEIMAAVYSEDAE